jgi:RNA polymerase sigma-70 factor (ECF subfamily)
MGESHGPTIVVHACNCPVGILGPMTIEPFGCPDRQRIMIEGDIARGRSVVHPAETERAALFGHLVDEDLARSYRLAALLLGSELEAQDAVQDAVVTAWERFDDLRDRDRFGAWFGRILVNGCRDRLRRRGRVRLLTLEAASDRPTPDGTAGLAEQEALRNAIGRLSNDHREVVVMRYLLDLPLDEIAARTGERLGTVKSRLHYGLEALRAAYDAADRGPLEASR